MANWKSKERYLRPIGAIKLYPDDNDNLAACLTTNKHDSAAIKLTDMFELQVGYKHPKLRFKQTHFRARET